MKERINRWPDDYETIFWRAYPRRVGKLAAMKKLGVIHKSDKVSWDTLLGAVRLYARDCETKDRRFVAHPLTWLNQGRWEDEIEVPPVFVSEVRVNGHIYVKRESSDWQQYAMRWREEHHRDNGPPVDKAGGWWFPVMAHV